MSATVSQEQAERAELEEVLQARIFHRAPSLALFLRYVCDRHFEGTADELKEYSIAVEALGRSPDFDQKKDAIVRVEAHRLRKRLADYYKTDGADHEIQIQIPSGQYAPRFVCSGQTPVAVAAPVEPELILTVESQPEILAAPPTGNLRSQRRGIWIVAVAAIILVGAFVAWLLLKHSAQHGSEMWQGPATEAVSSEFRMLAGYHGLPFTDRQGRTWQPDAYYNGGRSVALKKGSYMEGLPDPHFAQSEREGDFQYSIPERPGTYEVHLYFADVDADSPPASGQLFRVLINDTIVLDRFDLLSDAAALHRLTARVFRDVTPGADNRIHLKFEQQGRPPVLLALEILWSKPGTVRPVRIVASTHSVTDPDGSIWMADQYAVGGLLVARQSSIQNSELKPLFAGEHFGNFCYRIPLPPGKYRVRLFFAETYFGSELPFSRAAINAHVRIFNVFSDGATLLRNFDVSKEAGGANLAIVKTFDNLEPNAQGKIVIDFVPVQNYAEVNAIEITAEPNPEVR